MSCNDLPALPASISRLSQLRTLNLQHNKLSALPEWIQVWSVMLFLSCSYLLLTSSCCDISQELPALRQLDISHNPLQPDDHTIQQLRQRPDLTIICDEITQEKP